MCVHVYVCVCAHMCECVCGGGGRERERSKNEIVRGWEGGLGRQADRGREQPLNREMESLRETMCVGVFCVFAYCLFVHSKLV